MVRTITLPRFNVYSSLLYSARGGNLNPPVREATGHIIFYCECANQMNSVSNDAVNLRTRTRCQSACNIAQVNGKFLCPHWSI
ncbi:unnamed protein product [Dicrocoelium dendriticum]|nr:unnamed protein product [Dicrocoelium dendriticum]